MTELERVETVTGQVPLPGMGERQLRRRPVPITRPDGRIYRPRRLPEALITGYDGDVEGVAVERTHNVELAEQLARQVLHAEDPVACWLVEAPRLSWGRWRPDRRADGSTWVEDESGSTGMPVVFFNAEAW